MKQMDTERFVLPRKVLKLLMSALVVCVFATAAPATANDLTDFQKGVDAYKSGDFALAFKHWRPLASDGDPAAQFNLGRMYYYGQTVAQDRIEAFKWFLIAKQGGVGQAGTAISAIRPLLNPDEAREAYRRARAYQASAAATSRLVPEAKLPPVRSSPATR